MDKNTERWFRAGEKAKPKVDLLPSVPNEPGHIILPGDPDFSPPPSLEESVVAAPQLPNEVLEAAFTEVVDEVKAALDKEDKEPEVPEPAPGPTFKYHRPAQKKSFDIPMQKEIDATLLEDLPRRWERICYAQGQFRKDSHITLSGMVFFPGVGAQYTFKEGARGSFTVNPDQVSFQIPDVPEDASSIQGIQSGENRTVEVVDATVVGQGT